MRHKRVALIASHGAVGMPLHWRQAVHTQKEILHIMPSIIACSVFVASELGGTALALSRTYKTVLLSFPGNQKLYILAC